MTMQRLAYWPSMVRKESDGAGKSPSPPLPLLVGERSMGHRRSPRRWRLAARACARLGERPKNDNTGAHVTPPPRSRAMGFPSTKADIDDRDADSRHMAGQFRNGTAGAAGVRRTVRRGIPKFEVQKWKQAFEHSRRLAAQARRREADDLAWAEETKNVVHLKKKAFAQPALYFAASFEGFLRSRNSAPSRISDVRKPKPACNNSPPTVTRETDHGRMDNGLHAKRRAP